jgi:hypothetical protein
LTDEFGSFADRDLELHRTAVPPSLLARADEVIE